MLQPRTKADGWKSLGPVRHSAAPEFNALPRTESSPQRPTGHQIRTTTTVGGSEVNVGVLYGTPTRRSRHRPATMSAPDRRLPPLRSSCHPSAADDVVDLAAASPGAARHSGRLAATLRDRDDELRELRQTIDSNERALLRSLDDERRRWAAERQRLEAELLSASRRHGTLPVPGGSTFHSPSINHDAAPGARPQSSAAVVVVGPIQRPPPSTLDRSGAGDTGSRKFDSCFAGVRNCNTSESSLPPSVDDGDRGNVSSNTDNNEAGADRPNSSSAEFFDAEKLRRKLELCRQEFADERRRWADEKRVVVEYQLRLQVYCRQLVDRNQLLEEQLKTMSLELGRNGGSSGYSSDSAALVVQFLDDSNLLASSL